MGFVKKVWKDRISEHPARRILTDLQGNSEVYNVARSEGSVSQEGDAFSAANMNDLEQRVSDGIESATTVYQTTLTAGSTSVTFTNDLIDADSCFYFYADQAHYDLYPDSWSVSGHVLTVVYDAQSEDATVGVQILSGVVVNA